MSGIQHTCGRFMANTYALIGFHDFGDPYLKEVRGNCTRCGADLVAAPGWWNSWDAWHADEAVQS